MALFYAFVLVPASRYYIRNKVEEARERFESKSGSKIQIGEIEFSSWSKILLQNLLLIDSNGDSLVAIGKIEIKIYPLGFFMGNYFQNVRIDSMEIHALRRKDGTVNAVEMIRLLRKQPLQNSDVSPGGPGNVIEKFFEIKWPEVSATRINVDFKDLRWRNEIRYAARNFQISLKESLFRDAEIEALGEIIQPGQTNVLRVSGNLGRGNQTASVKCFFDTPIRMSHDLGETSFRSGEFKISAWKNLGDRQELRIVANLREWSILSETISDQKLKNMNPDVYLNLEFSGDSIKLNQGSQFALNEARLGILGWVSGLKENPEIQAQLHLPAMRLESLLTSLPFPLVKKIQTIRSKGLFEWELSVHLNTKKLDSIRVEPKLTLSPDFKILSMGDSLNFKMLRDTFEYVFEKENGFDSLIWLATSNPFYTPIDSIPRVMVESVIACEDNSFFKNDGFNVTQIERSLKDNIKEHKFARGASTISMQFVKNIFLSREKTLARKFQEMIITWLMNHEKLLDEKKDKDAHKKRLMEIYLNIIEWGPDIYGLRSASRFYFRKEPQNLTLGESVFLATIIPNPKKYDRYFEGGKSKKKHQDFMNLIAKLLYGKKAIDLETLNKNTPIHFELRGVASRHIHGYVQTDTTDSGDFDIH